MIYHWSLLQNHELLKTQRFLINVPDEDGNTPIHLCVLYGNFDLLEIFVDVALTIPDQNLINLKNHKNLTPLLIGVYLEEIEVSICSELLMMLPSSSRDKNKELKMLIPTTGLWSL